MNNFEKYLKYVVYCLIVMCFISCIFVFKTWIFPFITSKTILFRIFTELLFFVYIILAVKNKEYRPKKSWILYCLLIFSLIAVITSLFGMNPYLSFKGDIERMWGINTWLHLVLFFIVVTSVFKTKKEWFAFFNFILIFCCITAIVSSLQMTGVIKILSPGLRMDGFLGNVAYVAGVLLLGLLISLYFFIGKKNIGWKIFYGVLFLIQLPIFLRTQIRGANLAFWIVILILAIIFIFKSKNKYLKIALGVFVFLVVSVFTMAFINKDRDWVKNNFVFSKMTTMSFNTGTVRTRLISWNGGFQAFKENPIIGYGMENYYYAFDKYFQADYYNIAASETWFDRAHNMVMEVLVAHGIFGLISYLSIFVFTFFALYKIYKTNKEKNFLFCLFFSCIVIAYFIQNFFVFDSLAVTLTFFFILAHINFIYTEESLAKPIWESQTRNIFNWIMIIISAIVVLFMIFNVNVKQIGIVRQNYIVQKSFYQDNDFKKSLEEIKKLYAINSYLNKDSTTMLTDTISTIYKKANGQDQIRAVFDIINELISQYDYYLKINDKEAYMQMNLARLYIIRSNFYQPGSQDSRANLELAKKAIEKSTKQSPEKLHNYYFMANIELALGNMNSAIESLEIAIKYNDKYAESYMFMGNILKQMKDNRADEYINKALELNPELKIQIQ